MRFWALLLAGCACSALVASACSSAEKQPTNASGSSGAGADDDEPSDDDDDDTASSSGSSGRDASTPRDAATDAAKESFDATPFDAGPSGEGSSCDEAENLGTIPGDDVASPLTASGKCGTWLRVRVAETSTSAIGHALSAKLTLVSNGSANYDLFVYFDPDLDALECSKLQGSSTVPANRTDEVYVTWGEGYVPNNADDSRTLNVEVRGDCSDDSWTLLVQGYQDAPP